MAALFPSYRWPVLLKDETLMTRGLPLVATVGPAKWKVHFGPTVNSKQVGTDLHCLP